MTRWVGNQQVRWFRRIYPEYWFPDKIIRLKEKEYDYMSEDSDVILKYVMLDEIEENQELFQEYISGHETQISHSVTTIEGKVVEDVKKFGANKESYKSWLKWKVGEIDDLPQPV